MMEPEKLNELAAALSAAQGEFPVLEKKSKAYNYMYADLAETLQAINEPMKKHGLSIYHQLVIQDGRELLVSRLMHSSGQSIMTPMPLFYKADGKVNSMQALGSAITYAKRYNIGCLLNLAADKEVDDDGIKAGYVTEKVKLPVVTEEQADVIEGYLREFPESKKDLLSRFGVKEVCEIPYDKFDYVVNVFEKKRKG
jgi:hypothetical protein